MQIVISSGFRGRVLFSTVSTLSAGSLTRPYTNFDSGLLGQLVLTGCAALAGHPCTMAESERMQRGGLAHYPTHEGQASAVQLHRLEHFTA